MTAVINRNVGPKLDDPLIDDDLGDDDEEPATGTWEHEELAQVRVKVLRGHEKAINSCQLCFNDERILTASNDKTCKLWDANSGSCIQTYTGHTHNISSCSMPHEDPTKFCTGGWDKKLHLWDTETGKILWSTSYDGVVSTSYISHNGKYVVGSSDLDYTVFVYSVKDRTMIHNLKGHHTSLITSSKMNSEEDRVCSTSVDRRTKVYDMRSCEVTLKLKGHKNIVSNCSWSANDRFLCTASWDKTLCVWDVKTGVFRKNGPDVFQKGHEGSVSAVHFSYDNSLLVSSGYDGIVAIWDVANSVKKLSMKGHTDWVTDCGVSRDSKWVVSASKDKTVRLWNIEESDRLPSVMENRLSTGLTVIHCKNCQKPFSIAGDPKSNSKLCVFCRLADDTPQLEEEEDDNEEEEQNEEELEEEKGGKLQR